MSTGDKSLTFDQINAIEARANAATSGPWMAWENDWREDPDADIEVEILAGSALPDEDGRRSCFSLCTDTIAAHDFLCEDEAKVRIADAQFIANSRVDVPTLCAEVRRLVNRCARLERLIEEQDQQIETLTVEKHNLITKSEKLRKQLGAMCSKAMSLEEDLAEERASRNGIIVRLKEDIQC